MTDRPRRWVTEDAVLAEMERLNDASQGLVQDFARLAPEAARAEAAHKSMRAKRVLTARASGVKSMVEAETIAEADDLIGQAYLERLVAQAHVESTREALRSIRTNQDALRTAAASARDGVTGPGWRGPHDQPAQRHRP